MVTIEQRKKLGMKILRFLAKKEESNASDSLVSKEDIIKNFCSHKKTEVEAALSWISEQKPELVKNVLEPSRRSIEVTAYGIEFLRQRKVGCRWQVFTIVCTVIATVTGVWQLIR